MTLGTLAVGYCGGGGIRWGRSKALDDLNAPVIRGQQLSLQNLKGPAAKSATGVMTMAQAVSFRRRRPALPLSSYVGKFVSCSPSTHPLFSFGFTTDSRRTRIATMRTMYPRSIHPTSGPHEDGSGTAKTSSTTDVLLVVATPTAFVEASKKTNFDRLHTKFQLIGPEYLFYIVSSTRCFLLVQNLNL